MEATFEMPFMASLPKREKSRVAKLWDHFTEVKALMQDKGTLVPPTIAAELLEVHRSRIDQLVESGRLERIHFQGRPFITEVSLVRWAEAEHKNGRPMSNSDRWKCSKDLVTTAK